MRYTNRNSHSLADGYAEEFEDTEPEDYYDERYESDEDDEEIVIIPVKTKSKQEKFTITEDPECPDTISIKNFMANLPVVDDTPSEEIEWHTEPHIAAKEETARLAEEAILVAKVKDIMLEFWDKFYPEQSVSDEMFDCFIKSYRGVGYLLEYKHQKLNVCNAADSLKRFIAEKVPAPAASQPPPSAPAPTPPPQAVSGKKPTDAPVPKTVSAKKAVAKPAPETVQEFECANDWADAQVMKFLKERDMEKFTYNRIAQELKINHNQARNACSRLEKSPDIIAVRLKNPKNTKSTKNAMAGYSVYYKYALSGKLIRDSVGINKLGRLAQLLLDGISRDTGVGYKELLTKVRTYLICVDSTLFSDALKFLMELGVIDSNFGKHGKRQFVAIRKPDIEDVKNLMRSDKWSKYPQVNN